MKPFFATLLSVLTLAFATTALADHAPKRVMQFDNEKMSAWTVVIYPGKDKILPMHRHDHARVLVALTDGILRVTTDKGQSHDLKLQKDKAYFLEADAPGLHNDENVSGHPIKVIVIQMKA